MQQHEQTDRRHRPMPAPSRAQPWDRPGRCAGNPTVTRATHPRAAHPVDSMPHPEPHRAIDSSTPRGTPPPAPPTSRLTDLRPSDRKAAPMLPFSTVLHDQPRTNQPGSDRPGQQPAAARPEQLPEHPSGPLPAGPSSSHPQSTLENVRQQASSPGGQSTASRPSGSTERPCVMVVDELPIMRSAVVGMLQQAGARVVAESSDEQESLDALRDHDPDVVLIDVRMSRTDALRLISRIRIARPTAQIVAHTGAAHSELVEQAANVGALTVPGGEGTPWELLRAVDRAFNERRRLTGRLTATG